ncbi:MAG: hypothetical protein HY521_15285 [Proteobacteria bacterium]|nr:hypothetical protein [Pseudomonadota bacterium]
MTDAPSSELPLEELRYAGAVADKAIQHMLENGVSAITAASALLGGAMSLLARTHDEAGMLKVLDRAIESVRSGAFRDGDEPEPKPSNDA